MFVMPLAAAMAAAQALAPQQPLPVVNVPLVIAHGAPQGAPSLLRKPLDEEKSKPHIPEPALRHEEPGRQNVDEKSAPAANRPL